MLVQCAGCGAVVGAVPDVEGWLSRISADTAATKSEIGTLRHTMSALTKPR
jgi:hypothetical protein